MKKGDFLKKNNEEENDRPIITPLCETFVSFCYGNSRPVAEGLKEEKKIKIIKLIIINWRDLLQRRDHTKKRKRGGVITKPKWE